MFRLLQVQSRPISVFYERNISTAIYSMRAAAGPLSLAPEQMWSEAELRGRNAEIKWFTWVVTTIRGPSEADVDDTWLIFTMQSSGSGNHHTADLTCYRECIPWSPGINVTIWVNERSAGWRREDGHKKSFVADWRQAWTLGYLLLSVWKSGNNCWCHLFLSFWLLSDTTMYFESSLFSLIQSSTHIAILYLFR